MSRADIIRQKIMDALQPQVLEVIDESHLHADHAHSHPDGESHFRILVVATAFEGIAPLARQRRIYAILPEVQSGDIHALIMRLKTPQEYAGA